MADGNQANQSNAGLVIAIFGAAISFVAGLIAIVGAASISKFESIFAELEIRLPVITEMLIEIGSFLFILILLLLMIWPIVTLLIRKKAGIGLSILILANGFICCLAGAWLVIGLFVPILGIMTKVE